MAKTKSFVVKHESKISHLNDYNASFLHLYEKELNDKAAKELEDFKASHNEEDIAQKESELYRKNQLLIAKKKNKLYGKSAKKQAHYAKRDSMNEKRIWEIDFIRGLVIIGMLIDHFFYDFYGLFTSHMFANLPQFYLDIGAFANLYWVHPIRVTFRFIGIFFLFLVSGISCHFSRNSLKRSLIVIAAGGLMSIAFLVVAKIEGNMNDLVIVGAIAAIGICMLIYSLYKMAFSRFSKIYKWLTLGLAVAMLVMWGFVSYNNAIDKTNFWFFYNGYFFTLPVVSFNELGKNIGYVLLGTRYFGSDWMGLFPALGYTFLGAFIGETLYKNRKSIFGKYNEKLNRVTAPVVYCGRYSIWFYLSHQIVYIIILGAIALLMGATLLL